MMTLYDWLQEIGTPEPDWFLVGVCIDWCKDNNIDDETIAALECIARLQLWPAIWNSRKSCCWYTEYEIALYGLDIEKRRSSILPEEFALTHDPDYNPSRYALPNLLRPGKTFAECLHSFIGIWKVQPSSEEIFKEWGEKRWQLTSSTSSPTS